MKNFKLAALAILIMIPFSGQAQLLKKMKKKAENAVERTILNRTDQEAARGTDQGIDAVIKGDNNKKKDKKSNKNISDDDLISESDIENKVSDEQKEQLGNMIGEMNDNQSGFGSGAADVLDEYKFSYRATMKIKTGKKEEMEVDYLLQPDVPYFGFAAEQDGAKSVSVMDMENYSMVMFIEQGAYKLRMSQQADKKLIDKINKEKSNKQNDKDYLANLKEIEGKTILGYKCKGFETTNDEGTYRMWITSDTPVGFLGAGMEMDPDEFEIPAELLAMGKNAMVMEMQFTPVRGKKKDRLHMICTDFAKENKTIKSKEYKTMGF